MKKIILSLILSIFCLGLAGIASADDATNTATTTPTFDPVCMQNAIEKRDTALIVGIDAYVAAIKTALTARKDALKAAWLITDKTQRRSALKTAWKNFRTARDQARKDWKSAKRTAWKTFYADRKACGKVTSEDWTTSGVDNNI